MGSELREHSKPSPCVLVTRPQHQAQEFVSALEQAGLQAEVFPLIEIAPPLDAAPFEMALKHLQRYDLLILTSVNAVEAVMQFITQHALEVPESLEFVCVGTATQKSLKEWGYISATPESEFTAEGILELLRAMGVAGKHVLYPRAQKVRNFVIPELQNDGALVVAPIAYRTVAATDNADTLLHLLRNRVDIVSFTSSSAVHNYVTLLGENISLVPERIQYASIGPITSATAREYNLQIAYAAEPYTISALVEAIKAKVIL
ncbi:MAG: uroporphyrinogen-III synthase [Thermodesulfobacteriota bacterium]